MQRLISRLLTLAVCGAIMTTAWATNYTWNVAGTGNWSTTANWTLSPGTYPNLSGDKAIIYNSLPSGWPNSTTQTVTIDTSATGISGLNLELRDDDSASPPVVTNEPSNVIVRLQVNQDAAFNRVDWFNDVNGNGRSDAYIASTKTWSVNYLNMTGRFPNSIGGPGTLKFTADGGGAATYAYFGGTEQLSNSITVDHSTVTTMNYLQNGGGSYLEARDTTWIVGNAGADQAWNITGGSGVLVLQNRQVGNPWHFIKVGANVVDMGARSGGSPSFGVSLLRGNLQNVDETGQRNLFASATGTQVGGTAKIANYAWTESQRNTANPYFMYDKIGANLTVTAGGTFTLADRNQASENDVNVVWVLPTNTLTTTGATGHLTITDANAASTGRMGIYFSNATLSAGGDFKLTGPNTFANDGGVASSISAGGNVQVQSRNAAGFGTIDGLVGGATTAYDDFNLMATSLTMNGGGAKTLEWTTGAAPKPEPFTLAAGDFTAASNFVLDTLTLTGSTNAVYALNSVLYLDSNFFLNPGSSLAFTAPFGQIHIQDSDLSEVSRISGYLSGGQLPGWYMVTTAGVGISLVPEPTSLALLALAALASLRRRR